jgi:predicted dehydrogenase
VDTIRYAVVGCGGIATHYHLPALTALEGARFVVACDLIEERAAQGVRQFGAQEYSLDYRQVVRRDDIDLVCIFTKVDAHAEVAIAAAEAGKHIFLQKPFARSLREGQAMVDAAKANGVQLITSFMHRYFDESLAAAEWVQSGRLGRIEFVRMRNATGNLRHTAPSYGGALIDIGAHGIDLIRAVCGQDIRRVCTKIDADIAPQELASPPPGGYPPDERPLFGGEANAWLLYELASGVTVSHEVQWSQRGGASRFQMEVYGTCGSALLRLPRISDLLAISLAKGGDENSQQIEWVIPQLPGLPMGQAHHQAVLRAIREGSAVPPGSEGMAVLRVCEAARRSANSGCWVDVS